VSSLSLAEDLAALARRRKNPIMLFRCRSACSAFLVLLWLLSHPEIAGGTEQGTALPRIQAAAAEAYEVLEIERGTTGNIRLLRIRTLVRHPPRETWAVLQDLESWPAFLDLFSRVMPLGTVDDLVRYRFFVSPPWPVADFESVVRFKSMAEQRLLDWNVEEGGLAGTSGKIYLREVMGGSEIVYESYTSAGKSFPAWMVKIGLYLVVPGVLDDLCQRIAEKFPGLKENPP